MQMLREIWTYAELARSAVYAGEQGAREYGNGCWFLDERPMQALRGILPFWFPRANEIIRLIGSQTWMRSLPEPYGRCDTGRCKR